MQPVCVREKGVLEHVRLVLPVARTVTAYA
jgi:hypothetical protein